MIQNVNKNVNVIVNMDPKEVAEELWKLIEARLNNGTNYITNSQSTIKDLENAIEPLLSSTRRDGTSVSVYQVANELDKITRKALTRNTPTINTLDKEIMIRDIVADMMAYLKIFMSETIKSKNKVMHTSSRRILHNPPTINNNEQEDYVIINIKIYKKDLINAFDQLDII